MVNYSHSVAMKNSEKKLRQMESQLVHLEKGKKNRGRPAKELLKLRKEITSLRKMVYFEGLQQLKGGLLSKSSPRKPTGAEIRENCESSRERGHYVIKNPFGSGIKALSKEMDDALKKYPPRFSGIMVSANQVNYFKLGFKNEPKNSTTEAHKFVGELPPYVSSAKKQIPTVGLVSQNNKFVALPLLTAFLSSVLYTGLATRIKGKELRYIKGSFLETIPGIKEEDWKEPVHHSDFDGSKQVEGQAQPITFIICLKGETPLDFGARAKNPSKSDKEVRTDETVLECGDGVVFSWRQQHKTGRPRKFPTEIIHRIHFMLSGKKDDVDDEKDDQVYIHPNLNNMDKYNAILEST